MFGYKQIAACVNLSISLPVYGLLIFRIVTYKLKKSLVNATIFSTFQLLVVITQIIIRMLSEKEGGLCMESYVTQVHLVRWDIFITFSCLILMTTNHLKLMGSKSSTKHYWKHVPLLSISVAVGIVIFLISDTITQEVSCTLSVISRKERTRRSITNIIVFIIGGMPLLGLSVLAAYKQIGIFSNKDISSLSFKQTIIIKRLPQTNTAIISQNILTIIICFPWCLIQYNFFQTHNLLINELVFWIYSFKGALVNLVWFLCPSIMVYLGIENIWSDNEKSSKCPCILCSTKNSSSTLNACEELALQTLPRVNRRQIRTKKQLKVSNDCDSEILENDLTNKILRQTLKTKFNTKTHNENEHKSLTGHNENNNTKTLLSVPRLMLSGNRSVSFLTPSYTFKCPALVHSDFRGEGPFHMESDKFIQSESSRTMYSESKANIPIKATDEPGYNSSGTKKLIGPIKPFLVNNGIRTQSPIIQPRQSIQTIQYNSKDRVQPNKMCPLSNNNGRTGDPQSVPTSNITGRNVNDEQDEESLSYGDQTTIPLLPVTSHIKPTLRRGNNSTEERKPLMSSQLTHLSLNKDSIQHTRLSSYLHKSLPMTSIDNRQKQPIRFGSTPTVPNNSVSSLERVEKSVVRGLKADFSQQSSPSMNPSTDITDTKTMHYIPLRQTMNTDSALNVERRMRTTPHKEISASDDQLSKSNTFPKYNSTWTVSSTASDHLYEEYCPNQALYTSSERYSVCISRSSFSLSTSRISCISDHSYAECGPPKMLLHCASQNNSSDISNSLAKSRSDWTSGTSLMSEDHYEEYLPDQEQDYTVTPRSDVSTGHLSEEYFMTNSEKNSTSSHSFLGEDGNQNRASQTQTNNLSLTDDEETMYELYDEKS